MYRFRLRHYMYCYVSMYVVILCCKLSKHMYCYNHMNYERNKVFRKDSLGLVYNMNLRTNLKRDVQSMSRLTF